MNSESLKTILNKYEQKRISAFIDLENRKNKLYNENKKLQEIDDKLSLLSIQKTKALLQSNDLTILEDLKKDITALKSEKNTILKSLNIDEDFLKPIFECKLCNDTGYITNNYSTTLCNCLKQQLFDIKYNKTNIFNLENQTFKKFLSTIYSDNVDKTLYNSDISPKKNIEYIKNICLSFVDNFDDINTENLLFTGNTGLGKTFLSSCIANELLKNGKTVLYQTAPVMLDSIIDYRFNKLSSDEFIYNNLLDVDLLIIDDLGTESMNSLKFTELFNIINSRLLNTKKSTKTIISTNLSIQNLYSTYDERIVSRLIGNYKLCYFFGEDLRLKLKK